MSDDFRFDDHPGKDPAESDPVELDCFPMCANFWRANEQYSQGEFIRPNRPTGFAYEATSAGGGTSSGREPSWPTTLGATKVDGSVTWTCRAAGSNGLSPISNATAVSDPSGLTINAVSVTESTKILATYAGGVLDQDYDAVFTFTLNGVARVGRQRVPVRKR